MRVGGAGCGKSPAAGLPAEEGPDKLGAAPHPHLRATQSQAMLGGFGTCLLRRALYRRV